MTHVLTFELAYSVPRAYCTVHSQFIWRDGKETNELNTPHYPSARISSLYLLFETYEMHRK